MRFTLTQILTTVLVVALGLALVGNQFRHQQRIAALEHALYQARKDIAIAEFGSLAVHQVTCSTSTRSCGRHLN